MGIYFDMNVYNRMFDDQTQLRVRFESMAIDIIFELIEKRQYNLFWSFILEFENDKNPFINRREYIKSLSEICIDEVAPNQSIKELGYSGFLRFIRQVETSENDYIKLQEEIYKDMPLDELFSEAESNWNARKK